MAQLFSKSENFKDEYCCSVVRIGQVKPIEGTDFLATTIINGVQAVVRKDQIKEGDVYFYAMNETALNNDFLSINNLYEMSERHMNSNYREVETLLAQGFNAEARSQCGYFNKHGRVRMIRIRREPSQGFLFGLEELVRFKPEVANVDLESMVGEDFDTVCGELFCKAYVPPTTNRGYGGRSSGKKIRHYDRIVDGSFEYHYDTKMLGKHIHLFRPDDKVCLSVKMHGKSIILGNIQIKFPKKIFIFKKLWNCLCGLLKMDKHKFTDYELGYSLVASSRKVIRSEEINTQDHFNEYNIWADYGEKLKGYIPKDWFLYGEIVGYYPDGTMLQDGYDYGCPANESRLMPYRLVTKLEGGKDYEWNVTEVYDWTIHMIKLYPDLANVLMPLDILYHGKLGDMYPEIDTQNHWHENVFERMMTDERYGLEKDEPLCTANKVPREGFVLRLDNDPIKEAYKLKAVKFLAREKDCMDKGIVDGEVAEEYTSAE